MRKFPQKIVLITGGSRGIGLATARLFMSEGASVVIGAMDLMRGEKVAHETQVTFVQVDVRNSDECERIVSETIKKFGQLDVLINGAGVILRGRTVEQTSDQDWDMVMDTNVKGAFLMSKYALPFLRKTQGVIVNIASYTGLVGFPGASAYAASKAALINLTRTMALDYARENIRINCVCPGSVRTDMIFDAWKQYGDQDEAQRLWADKHPLGRIAEPDEVARAILFLASKDASFITGAALPVDGGITAA